MSREDLFHVLKDLVDLYRSGNLTKEEFQETKRLLLTQLAPPSSTNVPASQGLPTDALGPPATSGRPPLTPIEAQSAHPMFQQIVKPGQYLMGRYYLERLLGQGGMGQVFLCYDTVRESRYALKLIHPHLAQYEELRARFLQELKANERLTHPGIVRTYALEQDAASGFLFFTMEFVEGVTLDTVLRQAEEAQRVPPLPIQSLTRLLSELSAILEYAHAQGVIHRDLKPSNIMVTRQGHVKLMDFGIAKVLEGSNIQSHTGFGGFVYYMAPEQLRGSGEVTAAADVFSLGVVTYHLLTGELPMGAVSPPSRLWTQLDSTTDEIVLQAMSPRPHLRQQSPQAFWEQLQETLHNNHALFPTQQISRKSGPIAVPQEFLPEHPQEAKDHTLPELSPPDTDTGERAPYSSPGEASHIGAPPPKGPQTRTDIPSFSPDEATEEKELTPPPKTNTSNLPLYRNYRKASLNVPSSRVRATPSPGSKKVSTGELESFHAPLSTQMDDLGGGDELISLKPSALRQNDQPKAPISIELPTLSKLKEEPASPFAQELELELDESAGRGEPELIGLTARDWQRSAMDLPPVPSHLQEKFLYAHDGSPLLRLVKIPAGSFLMGSRESDSLAYRNELPQREVDLDTYWISRTPITNRVWLKFVEESSYYRDDPDYLQHWRGGRPQINKLEHPVVYVSYEDLEHFCLFYNVLIPTEAQWEKAARGTEGQIWPWGNQKPHTGLCNFLGAGTQDTTPVAAFLSGSSPYGVLDCSGNVWEWCADHWSLEWLEEMGENPHNPVHLESSSSAHAIRGGCFRYHGRGVRCAFRFSAKGRTDQIGARIIALDGGESEG